MCFAGALASKSTPNCQGKYRGTCDCSAARASFIGVSSQAKVTQGDLLKGKEVAWIQLHRALQIAQSLFVLAAPTRNVTGELENARVVR